MGIHWTLAAPTTAATIASLSQSRPQTSRLRCVQVRTSGAGACMRQQYGWQSTATPVYIAAAATGSRSGRSSAAMEEGVRKVLRLERAISCDTSSAVDGCWFIAVSLSTSLSAYMQKAC